MPVLIAFGLAITVSAIVILVVVRTAPRLDPADVQVQDVEAARHTGPVRRFLRRRVDPEAATGLLLSVALAITSSAILAVGALLEMAQRNEGFARWDQAAAEFGARHSTDRVETMFRWVTNLGATWFAAAALAAGPSSPTAGRRFGPCPSSPPPC